MDALWKDVRFALRMLRRTPGVSAAAIVALALGIGANTAIFSVVDGVLLRPLPYRDSKALAVLNGKFPVQRLLNIPLSVPELKDVGEQSRVLSSVGGFTQGDSNLSGGVGAPERVCVRRGARRASFPRSASSRRSGATSPPTSSCAGRTTWCCSPTGCGGSASAPTRPSSARALALDGETFQIIGVLPRGFQIDGPCDVWTPLPCRTIPG